MTTPMNQQTVVNGGLSTRAMLVSLNISQWSAKKNDKRVDKEVSDNHGSDIAMGRYNKNLLPPEALQRIGKIASAARVEHYSRTLPWRDDGYRILSSAGYFAHGAKLGEFERDYYAAVKSFLSSYHRYVDDARSKLNGLFNESEYPSVDKVERKFRFGLTVNPLPDAGDFRVALGDTEVQVIRAEITADIQQTVQNSMKEVWQRLYNVVERMSDRLHGFQRDSTGHVVAGEFRDSLVTNISELIELLPSLNIMQDKALDAMARTVQVDLTAYSPAELREQDTVRERVANQADAILAAISDFI